VSGDSIARILAGSFPDPDGGPSLTVATRSVVIARSLEGMEADIVAPLGLGRRLAIVSDPTTHDVLGARVERALAGRSDVSSVRLPDQPHADEATVERIRAATVQADALIAVGSGTINDLCKYASAVDRKPYAVFGTAPSMNGYTSLNAAITVHGHKKSLAAQAPLGAFFDVGLLAAAPVRMIRSGLGDSLCRTTAQADWLLSHLLFDTPYRSMPFVLLAEDEPALFAEPDALLAGDLAAMERLVRTLVLSGFGTAICGNSQPASQGEHLVSHYADMLGDSVFPFSFHGEQIGVTTLSMARLQHHLLNGPPPRLRPDAEDEAAFVARFGGELGRSCWKEFAGKRLDEKSARALNERVLASWAHIRETIQAILLPVPFLEAVLQRAGNPRSPNDVGWPRSFYGTALRHAREIRNRYTFLDLAANSGALERLADAI
jgi:glycerol-1-phosphate dehydrogenase [NAD(P)+]